jgi:hypothetical protein
MADKPNTEKKTKAKTPKTTDPVAAESAPLAEATPEPKPHRISMKKGKLLPKNKHRLPRRQKKAQQKAAARL